MSFKEFEKHLKGIKYKVKGDWDIRLKHGTKPETIQKIIDVCKEHLVIDWHIIYPEETEKELEPDIEVYWDRKNG